MFDVEAFHYLLKPLNENKLKAVLLRAVQEKRREKEREPLFAKVNGRSRHDPAEKRRNYLNGKTKIQQVCCSICKIFTRETVKKRGKWDMRIGNRTNMTLARARMTRIAKTRAYTNPGKSSGKTGSTGGTSLADLIRQMMKNDKTSATDKVAENQNSMYNCKVTKQAAERVQGYLEKLSATGEESVFEKSDEEAKEAAVKEIKNFVDSYNILMGQLSRSDNATDTALAKKMRDTVSACGADLEKLGIKQSSNGILSVNTNVLEEADLAELKKTFGPEGKFGEKIAEQTKLTAENAEKRLEELQKSIYQTSTNYNRYGSDNSSYSCGSRYSAKG